MRDIKLDFVTNTIVVTKSFLKAAEDYDSDEAKELKKIKKSYPNMVVESRYSNRRTGSRKPETKGLTYKYMRKFISVMDSENLITFEKVILHYENYEETNAGVYNSVKDWFLENYPYHKEMIADSAPRRVLKAVPEKETAAA